MGNDVCVKCWHPITTDPAKKDRGFALDEKDRVCIFCEATHEAKECLKMIRSSFAGDVRNVKNRKMCSREGYLVSHLEARKYNWKNYYKKSNDPYWLKIFNDTVDGSYQELLNIDEDNSMNEATDY